MQPAGVFVIRLLHGWQNRQHRTGFTGHL